MHLAGVSSASGWVTQRLGGFPREGDTVPVGAFMLRVEETRGARVTRLKLVRATPVPARDPAGNVLGIYQERALASERRTS